MLDIFDQKAAMLADELHASDQGRELIKGLIAQWQFNGFVAGIAHKPANNKTLWSVHHRAGYALACKLGRGVRQ